MKFSTLIKTAAVATAFAINALPAAATVADFETKPAFSCVPNSTQSDNGLNYSYDFYACYYSNANPADFPTHPSSTVMASGYSNTTFTLAAGGPFSLNSVDLALGPYAGALATTIVTGNLHGGGTVMMSLLVDQSFDTYVLNWTNLDSVVFGQLSSDGYLGFDNIVYNDAGAVPEPGSLALAALALAGVAAIRRRKKA